MFRGQTLPRGYEPQTARILLYRIHGNTVTERERGAVTELNASIYAALRLVEVCYHGRSQAVTRGNTRPLISAKCAPRPPATLARQLATADRLPLAWRRCHRQAAPQERQCTRCVALPAHRCRPRGARSTFGVGVLDGGQCCARRWPLVLDDASTVRRRCVHGASTVLDAHARRCQAGSAGAFDGWRRCVRRCAARRRSASKVLDGAFDGAKRTHERRLICGRHSWRVPGLLGSMRSSAIGSAGHSTRR